MKLEQAYWGNKGSGYSILNNTAPVYGNIIETLCADMGTPSYKNCPILFSYSTPDILFMGCCRKGRPDASRRETLFFHIIFGDRKQCTEYAINTWSLFQNSAFKVEYDAALEPLEISEPLSMSNLAPAAFTWNGMPTVIQSEHAENELICALLGDRINSVSWFGYSAKNMDKATLYAASADTIRLAGVASYTTAGEKIPPHIVSAPSNPISKGTSVPPQAPHKRCILPWIIVIILIGVIVMLSGKGKADGTQISPQQQTTQTDVVYKNKLTAISKELEGFDIDIEIQNVKFWKNDKINEISEEFGGDLLRKISQKIKNIKKIIQ